MRTRWIWFCVAAFLGAAAHRAPAQEAQPVPTGGAPARGSLIEDRAAAKLLEAGDARFDADEFAKAVEVWQSVIERYPRSKVRFAAHMRLGNYLLDRERAYDRARVHFEAAAGEDNREEAERAEATLKLGVCFYEARNYGKSFTVMREVIEKFPISSQVNEAYYYIGLGHFQLGHYSRAIEALDKVGTALSSDEGKVEKAEMGKRLFVKVDDADLAALEPGQNVKVRCETTAGDAETVECLTIGRNVRVVLGSMITRLGKPVPENGQLEVRGDDKIKVTYIDSHTGDRQFDRPVLKEIAVVGDAIVQITDGAFSETLQGVVLDREVNIQITDPDRDLTDAAEQINAAIEVYREKTTEELEAEQAKAAAQQTAAATDPAQQVAAVEPQIDPYKQIDRVEIALTEAKIVRETLVLPESGEPGETQTPVEAETNRSAPEGKNADVKNTDTQSPKVKPEAAKGVVPKSAPALKSSRVVRRSMFLLTAAPGKSDHTGQPTANAAEAQPKSPGEDTTIHTGVFRTEITLAKNETAIAGDNILQALPGDLIRVTYNDEWNTSEAPILARAQARAVEGNLGSVRVTRSQISDQELRIQTQLKTADALTNIGNRYKEFGLKKNAEAKYAQALAVCENISEDSQRLGGHLLENTYVQLWQIYYEMDKFELAAAMCQRLQQEFPNSGFVDDALLKLAEVVRKQGDLQRAVGIYDRLVNMQGSQLRGEAQFGIADCYETMAKQATGPAAAQLYDRAFQEYKKVFDGFPESGRVGEAVAKMANYYYQQKDYARAIDIFETVLADHPDAKFLDVILFNYGRCLYRMERKADARRQFDQLIGEFPESPLAADAKKISEALAKSGF